MKADKVKKESGFSLIELLIAIALGVIVLAVIFSTFKSQQDSYLLQGQVSMAQQNLRAALYMITRDIQMAGYYTSFVDAEYSSDWDDNPKTSDVAIMPLIYLINNAKGIPDVKDGTDILVIVKASDKYRRLEAGEKGNPGDPATAGLILASWVKNGKVKDARDLDGDGEIDLKYYTGAGHTKYAILVKEDLRRAEVFEVGADNSFIFKSGLVEAYGEGDSIHKLDVIMYLIDNSDPAHPCLSRRNIGTDNSFSVIAEDMDDLQFEFILRDGSITDNLDDSSNIPSVRAVKAYLITRSETTLKGYTDPGTYDMGAAGIYKPADSYVRRLLSSTVKTRNIGDL
jgi:prepilin-type N-terminal cleavage/methylation domain-containing protein